MPRRPALMVAYDNAAQRTLLAAREDIDMVIVPGTIAAYAQDGISRFLGGLDRPYLIDPRTPVFQFPGAKLRQGERALAYAHGEAFAEVVAADHAIAPTDEDWLQAATAMARYQRDYANCCTSGRPPTTIVAPYLLSETPLGKEWDLSLAMLQEAQRAVLELPVTAVAALASSEATAPEFESLDEMLSDLGRISRTERVTPVLMLLDRFDEYAVTPETVAHLARLVMKRHVPALFNLYGGYLSLLLHHFGLAGVASGVVYGHRRGVRERPEVEFRPPGYYVTLIHTALEPEAAQDLLLQVGRDAECGCRVCLESAPGGLVTRLNWQQLRLHFAHCRAAERAHVADTNLERLIEELHEAERIVAAAVNRTGASWLIRDVLYRHLGAWARGLTLATREPSLGTA